MTTNQPSSQGAKVNTQGNILERTIIPALTSKGFSLVSYRDWENNPDQYGNELLLKHVPYTTIYGHRGYTEFLLKSIRLNLEIRIECKWQQVSGSVDEKFPYLYINCLEAMHEREIIIIADGGGMKPGSLNWLRNAIETKLYCHPASPVKKIKLFNLSQFVVWANGALR